MSATSEVIGSVAVQITGDPTNLNAAFSRAEAAASAAGEKIATQFNGSISSIKTAARDVQTAMENLRQASLQLGPAAQAGSEVAITALVQYEAELTQATLKLEEMTAASAHAVTEIQATSGAIRVMEGSGGIRAMERFVAGTLGLGGAMQAIFPIVGAVAFGEQLYKLWERFDPLIAAEKEAEKQTERLDKEYEQLGRRLEQIAIREATLEFGKASGFKTAAMYDQQAFDADQDRLKQVEKKIQDISLKLQAGGFASIVPGFIGQFLTQRSEAAANVQLQQLEKERENLQRKATVDERDEGVKRLEQQRELARDAAEAARKATQDLKQNDELQLAIQKSHHELSAGQLISYWRKRLAEESTNADRVREIQITLGNLYQQQDRQMDAVAQKSIKRTEDEARAAEKVQSFLSGMAAEADENIDRATQKIQDTQSRLAGVGARGAAARQDASVERSQLEAQRAYGLELNHTFQQQIAFMREMEAFDSKQREIKADRLKAEADIALKRGDEVKAAELQQQAEAVLLDDVNKRYKAETEIKKLQREHSLEFKANQAFQTIPGSLGSTLAKGVFDGGKIGQEIQNSLKNVGKQILGDVFTAAIRQLIIKLGIQSAVDSLLAAVFGSASATNSAAVAVNTIATASLAVVNTTLIAAISALTAAIDLNTIFSGFASGGRPPVGVPSMVGERGPELFIPDQGGTIIPNSRLGDYAGVGAYSASSSYSSQSVGDMHFHVYGAGDPDKFARHVARQLPAVLKQRSPRFSPAGGRR